LKAGLAAAAMGLMNLVLNVTRIRLTPLERVAFVVLVPAASFALFFGLVFSLAYFFAPSSTDLSGRLSFPGARKVVWPLVALLIGATVWFVITRR
jgi:glucan phosphoethanolaminetransferase (alkaline phosphatase superfamily)